MSYYRVFKPTQDYIDGLTKKRLKDTTIITDIEIKICMYCMHDHSDDNIENIIKDIRFMVNNLKWYAEMLAFNYPVESYEENDGEITFCGRQYDDSSEDIQETIDHVVEKLAILAYNVKTPSWFDENEKFYEKYTEVSETIRGIADSVLLNAELKLIEEMKDFEDPEDDYMYYKNHSIQQDRCETDEKQNSESEIEK